MKWPAISLCILLLCACSSSDDNSNTGNNSSATIDGISTLRSDAARNNTPAVTATTQSTFARERNDFSLALYQQLRQQSDDNLVLSPFSVDTALAMAYAGANGATASQMLDALQSSLSEDTLHAAFNQRDLALQDRPLRTGAPNDSDFALSTRNGVFAQVGFAVQDSFLDVLAKNYDAGLQTLDFAGDSESARQAINNWVAEGTNDLIPELLSTPPEALTRMMLVNAVGFQGDWLAPFDPDSQPADFTRLDGSTQSVTMMRNEARLPYTSMAGLQAVALPYVAEGMEMLVILPDAGSFASVENSLSSNQLSQIRASMSSTSVLLHLPRFSFASQSNLNTILQALGMRDAFTPGTADFSAIPVELQELYISSVQHAARISVDEQGTEAAAATSVSIGVTSAPINQVSMRVDRPFLFALHDTQTETVLFLGRVLQP